MEKKDLKEYRILKQKIKELNEMINEKETGQSKKNDELKKEWKNQNERAERTVLEVEEFITGIKDTKDQMIFGYLYIKGMTQKEVAKKLFMDRSRISRRVDDYIKRTQSTK